MAYYLVRAKPKQDQLGKLEELLKQNAFVGLRPFGKALSLSLCGARIGADGVAFWEEEDYCTPPLKEERAAMLDRYFDNIEVEPVQPEEGWKRISDLPMLFPELTEVSE